MPIVIDGGSDVGAAGLTIGTTFLKLCQEAAKECGVSLTGPTATTGQTGRLGQIIGWVNKSWLDIQTKHDDWKWMIGSFTVNTTASDGQYEYSDCTDATAGTAIERFRSWRTDTFKIYLTASGSDTETDLQYVDYDYWYQRWNTGAQSDSHQIHFTIGPDQSILLGPKPGGIYTVRGEYQKSARELSGDDDQPDIPAEYRMAIVYRTMMKYGRYNAAPEVFSDGQAEYNRLMREMSRTQRQPLLVGAALA